MAALRSGRISHAYLFSGPRGCGKTTSARIMARCLNCAEGPTDTPCGKCESCKDLATGGPGSLDVVEIDAASHNGVDDARELRERAGFAPVRDRYKIFILDEAHMVTQQGFNALLKIVEEPPEHVKFIFATTEPDKVIGTIRSRTHHYPFRLVPPETMEKYMAKLCEAENIEPAPGVLQLVMRAGAGSVRDSLSVLDQLMAGAEDGKLAYGTAAALLGYTDSSILERSVDAIIDRDGAALFEVIAKMVEGGHDPRRYLEDLLLRLRDLLVLSVSSPEDAQAALAGTPEDQLATMNAQAQRWGTAGISHASDLTNTALTELTGATAPRLQVELLAARLLLPLERQGTAAPGVTGPDSLSGAERAQAALHRPGRRRPQNTGSEPQAPAAPMATGAVKAPGEKAPVAPRSSAVPVAPRNGSGTPELAAPRPPLAASKQPFPAELKAPSPQESESRNETVKKSSAPTVAAADSGSAREGEAVAKGEQYWQVLQAWGKVSSRLQQMDPRLWSTCNRHLQIGGAQDQKLTLLADGPQTIQHLENHLEPIEKCLEEELSDSWTVQVLPGSDDHRAPALSQVLSQVKLEEAPTPPEVVPEEAPPEEELYPPEGEELAAGGEEKSSPLPNAGEVKADADASASQEAVEPISKGHGETGKKTGESQDEGQLASENTEWIIPGQAPAPAYGGESAPPASSFPQAPRAQAPAGEPLSAPRPPAATTNGREEGSTAPQTAPSYEEEDLPDLSDPDASLEESGGRWGVEVAKSLLGGKIVETAENDSASN